MTPYSKESVLPSLATTILISPLAALSAPLPAQVAVTAPLVEVAQDEQGQPSGPLIDQTLAEVSWQLTDNLAPQEQQQSGQGQEQTGDTEETEEPVDVIIVSGDYGPPKEDPLMRANERVFDVAESVDQAVVGPIAYAYEEALPSPLRQGSRNVLRNLREPTNFLNFLLQGKFGKAMETLGRFAIKAQPLCATLSGPDWIRLCSPPSSANRSTHPNMACRLMFSARSISGSNLMSNWRTFAIRMTPMSSCARNIWRSGTMRSIC